MKKFNAESSHINFTFKSNNMDIQRTNVWIVFLFFLNNPCRQSSRIKWGISDSGHDMRNGSNVVHMSVSDEYSFDILFSPFEIVDVGNNVINPRHIFFWKLKSHIHDDDVSIIFE